MANGIINVYKEQGFTSFDVVAKLRGMLHQKKIGHTGTLDPDAQGVLPVCLGKATKVCDLLTDKDKVYEAVLLLGKRTDTLDISGEVLEERAVQVDEEFVRETIMSFVGEIEQIPPMYSALKVNGQKLCDLARKGVTVERKSIKVTIHSIDIIEVKLPEVRFSVHCSKGTYIRTLCDDIGQKLGCLGCMKSLIRTRVDMFALENALKLDEIQRLVDDNRIEEAILPIDMVFNGYARIHTKEEALKLVSNGNKVPLNLVMEFDIKEDKVRLYDHNDRFIGIYQYDRKNLLYKPIKIFME